MAIHIANFGAGPPLVLLHGVLRQHKDFKTLLPTLSKTWHVHAPDFRGHGLSDWSPDGYRVLDYAQDALAIMDQVPPQPAIVLGHSLGAMVAAVVASRLPHRVRSLILEDPPFQTMGSGIRESSLLDYFQQVQQAVSRDVSPAELAAAIGDIRVTLPDKSGTVPLREVRDQASLNHFAACLIQVDPAVFTPIVSGSWLDGYDLPSIFERITCPVLLVQGDAARGAMLTDHDASLVERTCANCKRVTLSGVGHQIHWERPAEMLELIDSFVASLPPDH